MLPFPDMVYLFADELARLCAGRFALRRIFPRSAQCLLFRHNNFPPIFLLWLKRTLSFSSPCDPSAKSLHSRLSRVWLSFPSRIACSLACHTLEQKNEHPAKAVSKPSISIPIESTFLRFAISIRLSNPTAP